MSMMKTLARVAAGVMLAKGIGGMMQQANAGQTRGSSRTTGGGLLGELLGGGQNRGGAAGGLGGMLGGGAASGGLGGMLGQVLGGGAGTGSRYSGPNSRGAQGGLGGILDQLTNSARGGQTAGSGGLGDLLGQMAGGNPRAGRTAQSGDPMGGLGGLLGGLLGGAAAGAAGGALARRGSQEQNDASFGELFNDAVARNDEPEVAPTPEQNAVAGLMLKAMIQAAKADGKIDEAEKQRLLGQVGDLDEEEKTFIREAMAAPVDVQGLAREVPKGLEQQVYLMSLMSIDFDNEREARYLNDLAQAMNLPREQVNAIHQHVGVQALYA